MLTSKELNDAISVHRKPLYHKYALEDLTEIDRGRYTIIALIYISQNGFVYQARHNATAKNVIIKEFFPLVTLYNSNSNETTGIKANREKGAKHLEFNADVHGGSNVFDHALRKFLVEAEVLKAITPHNKGQFTELIDVFEVNNTAYIVLAEIPIPTLEELLLTGYIFAPESLHHFLHALLDAVESLHELGYLHRDLKPSNIFYDGHQVIIGDFCTARRIANNDVSYTMMYTEGYAAPEQMHENTDLGTWTDVYALGCILGLICGMPTSGKSTSTKTPGSTNTECPYCNQAFMESLLHADIKLRAQNIPQVRQSLHILESSAQLSTHQLEASNHQKRKLNFRLRVTSLSSLTLGTIALVLLILLLNKTPTTEYLAISPNAIPLPLGAMVSETKTPRQPIVQPLSTGPLTPEPSTEVLVQGANAQSATQSATQAETQALARIALATVGQTTPTIQEIERVTQSPINNDLPGPLVDRKIPDPKTTISFDQNPSYAYKVDDPCTVRWSYPKDVYGYNITLTNRDSWEIIVPNQKQSENYFNLANHSLKPANYRLYVQPIHVNNEPEICQYTDIRVIENSEQGAPLQAPTVASKEIYHVAKNPLTLAWQYDQSKLVEGAGSGSDSGNGKVQLEFSLRIAQISDAKQNAVHQEPTMLTTTNYNYDISKYLTESGKYKISIVASTGTLKSTSCQLIVYVSGQETLLPPRILLDHIPVYHKGDALIVNWEPNKEAVKYQLRIYSLANGMVYLSDKEIPKDRTHYDMSIIPFDYGSYIMQLRYQTADGRWSPFHEKQFTADLR